MNKQMGAPYVRAAPLNVCFRHHPAKDALRAQKKKRRKKERERKIKAGCTHIHHQQGWSHSWQRCWILTLSSDQSQCCIQSLLLWICLGRAESTPPKRPWLQIWWRKNKSNALQPNCCVYTDDTQEQPRNPSSGSVLKDRQPQTGCGPEVYQGIMPMSPLSIRLQGNGASYAKCNMHR